MTMTSSQTQTHAQLLSGRKLLPGQDVPACDGPVRELGTYPDRSLLLDGLVHERVITVWRCTACEARISITGGVILNHYQGPTSPVQLGPSPLEPLLRKIAAHHRLAVNPTP